MRIFNEQVVCVLLYFVLGQVCCQDDLVGDDDIDSYGDTCYLYFYYGDPESPQFIKSTVKSVNDVSNALKQNTQYTGRLIIYIHGWMESIASTSVQTMVKAHLQRGKDYIIVLDWSKWASNIYSISRARTRPVARAMAFTLNGLNSKNYTFSRLQIVGHSLGAHVAGFIGRNTNFVIPRITGLDPANPGFYGPGQDHISASDGKYVDIIHTDGGAFGVSEPTGTADFYPNGGIRPQPGCPLIGITSPESAFCSHQKSWRYYAITVLNEKAFLATKCERYKAYRDGKCDDNIHAYCGYDSPTNISGIYYFTTNL